MNIPIYDGNPLWSPNATAFGFYNNDVEFQEDCIKVSKFVTTRLGYPLMDVELQTSSIFTAFEEANSFGSFELKSLSTNGLITICMKGSEGILWLRMIAPKASTRQ